MAAVLRPLLADINMVSAVTTAKDRGIMIEEVKRGQDGAYESYVRLTVKSNDYERSVAGTVFSDGRPRIIHRSIATTTIDIETGRPLILDTSVVLNDKTERQIRGVSSGLPKRIRSAAAAATALGLEGAKPDKGAAEKPRA